LDLLLLEKEYWQAIRRCCDDASAPFDASPNPYTAFKRAGQVQVAGLMKRPDGMNMPPFWAMYVAVPKLEEAVGQHRPKNALRGRRKSARRHGTS
jgi:hypothetical protein